MSNRAWQCYSGNFILIRYAVRGPPLFHSRILILQNPNNPARGFIITPDGDAYDEDIEVSSDVAAVHHLPCSRAYPLSVASDQVYEFRKLPTAARLKTAYQTACAEYGLDIDPGFAVEPKTAAAIQDGSPRSEHAGEKAKGDDGLTGLIQALGNGSPGPSKLPVKGILDQKPTAGGSETPPTPQGDLRTIAVAYDKQGIRHRHFKDAVDLMSEEDWADWPIQGPRTVLWLMNWFADNGGSPMQWFSRFKADGRFGDGVPTVDELERLCRLLTYMTQYDQLNVGNLAAGEAVARSIQAVCMTHKDRFIGKGDNSEFAIVYGTSASGSMLPIAPALREWLGEETRKANLAAKELRKAREERALMKPKPKANKSGE